MVRSSYIGARQGEAPKREGANSGTLAVRGVLFHDVMRAWAEVDEGEPLRDTRFP